jgi:hypothetical protein
VWKSELEDDFLSRKIYGKVGVIIYNSYEMGKENKSWSEHVSCWDIQEDSVLRSLREERGLKKWSSISRIME